jgi:hypothetical protein
MMSLESLEDLKKAWMRSSYTLSQGKQEKMFGPASFYTLSEIDHMLQSLTSKSCLSKNSLAVFDKFAANAKGDPRAKTLSGSALEDLCRKLKESEPFLTTTKVHAILCVCAVV